MSLTHALSIPVGTGLTSSADLSEKNGYWGAVSSEQIALAAPGSGTHGLGIITDGGTESGSPVALHRGVVQALIGTGGVSAGDIITCDVNGLTVAPTTSSPYDKILGIALEDGAAEELAWVSINFVPGTFASVKS